MQKSFEPILEYSLWAGEMEKDEQMTSTGFRTKENKNKIIRVSFNIKKMKINLEKISTN